MFCRMSDKEPSFEELTKSLMIYIAQRMKKGASDKKIQEELVAKGLQEATAMTLVSKMRAAYDRESAKAGPKNMLIGALWCVGGIIVTAVTFSLATGGGTYVVAWGAIVFGAVQFIKGVIQTQKGKNISDSDASVTDARTPGYSAGPSAPETSSGGEQPASMFSSQNARFEFKPGRTDLGPIFIPWNGLPDIAGHEIAAAIAGTGAGKPIAGGPDSPARRILMRVPFAAAGIALGLIYFFTRMGNAANSTVDLVVFCVASFGILLTAALLASDAMRAKKAAFPAGRYALASCVADVGLSGMTLRPLAAATNIRRAADSTPKSPKIAVSFTDKFFTLPVRDGNPDDACNALIKCHEAASSDPDLRSDPFARHSLLNPARAMPGQPVRKPIPAVLPAAAAAAVLAVAAGYGIWTLFNTASDDAMYSALMEDLSTPAYGEYRQKGGAHEVPAQDLAEADRKKAWARFEEIKAEESVEALRVFLGNPSAYPEITEAAHGEISALYDKAYAAFLQNVPENKQLTSYMKDLIAYFKAAGTSTLYVHFEHPSDAHLEAMDKLLAALSELDAPIAPVNGVFTEESSWLSYATATSSLQRGLRTAMPHNAIDVVYDAGIDMGKDVPILYVSCILMPNGDIYESSTVSGTESSSDLDYKYFAGLDINFDMKFTLPSKKKEYSCQLTVTPPDSFTTYSSSIYDFGLESMKTYRAMIWEAFKTLPDQFLETVCGMELDEQEKNHLMLEGLAGTDL